VLGGREEIFCAADVGLVNIFGALGPEAVIGGNVKDALYAFESALKRGWIAQIAGNIFQREIGNSTIMTGSPQEDADFIAAGDKLPGDVTPKEAGCARDQSSHAVG
jgi:hypothetical protein